MNEHRLGGISLLTTGRSRSVSPENPTGERGRGGAATAGTGASAARELGPGWKVSPSIEVPGGSTAVLADLAGPGVIRHVWLTSHQSVWRSLVLRAYWDGAASPAIAVPAGDFFCQGWGEYAQVSSQPIAVNPNGGLNSYWEMPYRKTARIELENLGSGAAVVYFQIDYELADVDDNAGYLHAQWHRNNPLPYGDAHTVLDAVRDRGHYVGTYLAWDRTAQDGGARVRSSSTLTATETCPQSAEPGPKTISAVHGTSTSRAMATPPTARRSLACRRSCVPTACTAASSVSACIAGTYPTRSDSRPTSG